MQKAQSEDLGGGRRERQNTQKMEYKHAIPNNSDSRDNVIATHHRSLSNTTIYPASQLNGLSNPNNEDVRYTIYLSLGWIFVVHDTTLSVDVHQMCPTTEKGRKLEHSMADKCLHT